jgi:hypothetical protein
VGELIGSQLSDDVWARFQRAGNVVALVASAGDSGPDVAPVSLVHVASQSRILLGLARDRRTLANVIAGSPLAVSLILVPDVALTVHGTARVLVERMQAAEHVAAVQLTAHTVKDDRHPSTEITAQLAYRWTDPLRDAIDAALLAELRSL